MLKRTTFWASVAVLLAALGCESSSDMGGGRSMSMDDLATKIEDKPKAAPAAAAPANAAATAPANAAPSLPSREASPPALPSRTDPAAASGTVPADAKKASDQGAPRTQGGYMGAVIGANRSIRERVSDLSWQKSVQLFEAEKGHKPKNTEEFLERIRSEGTPLPEIDKGYTYLYVPEEGQFGELYRVAVEQTPSGQTPPSR